MSIKVKFRLITMLTCSRFLLGILFFVTIFIEQNRFLYASLLFGLIVLSDVWDGKLARKHQVVTNIGTFLDVFADFFYIFLAHLGLYFNGEVTIWMVVLILVKFVEFLLTSYYVKRKCKLKRELWFDRLGKLAALLLFVAPMLLMSRFSGGILSMPSFVLQAILIIIAALNIAVAGMRLFYVMMLSKQTKSSLQQNL